MSFASEVASRHFELSETMDGEGVKDVGLGEETGVRVGWTWVDIDDPEASQQDR
jgi:hypothetical protein